MKRKIANQKNAEKYQLGEHPFDSKLMMAAALSYINAGEEGFKKILSIYDAKRIETIIWQDYHPSIQDYHHSSLTQALQQREATLPALEIVAYKYFTKGKYLKALEAFHKLIVWKLKNLDIFFTAKDTVKQILELPHILELSQAQLKHLIKSGYDPKEDLISFLKDKMQEYHRDAKLLLPSFAKELLKTLTNYIGIKGLMEEILSFLVIGENFESIAMLEKSIATSQENTLIEAAGQTDEL